MLTNSWHRRRALQAAWDLASWTIALPLAILLRYDLSAPSHILWRAIFAGLAAGIVHVALGKVIHLYGGRYVSGSFDEVFGVVITTFAVGVMGTTTLFIVPTSQIPRSTFVIASGIAVGSMLGARFVWRATHQKTALSRTGTRTLIYGAGDAGSQLVNLMMADRSGQFQPVGFVDDDPTKRHLRRYGIRVLGTSDDLEAVVEKSGAEKLLVAIAGINSAQLLELDRRCKQLDVTIQVIPTASEIAGGAIRLRDISDVAEEDLLGRRPIPTDELQITDFFRGKRVLVTGAGGSIGSELCRQLQRYSPQDLFLLDRDESALHSVQLTLDGSGTLTSKNLFLVDIRDQERISQIMADVRPEIVFHAAALKHLPLLERFPDEAFKTNVLGTLNVLSASQKADVSVFVNISTDKAADPTSVLGRSKRLTEGLTASHKATGADKYVSVRFGNVLGSRGSVIETFRYQIAHGGPVTVTDARVTRFFMTIKEAVHLVLQASVIGKNGETLILDMGKPVSIADVARYMIERSGRSLKIEFTGLRPGEKIHEVLNSANESTNRPLHPLISHTRVEPIPHDAATLKSSFDIVD